MAEHEWLTNKSLGPGWCIAAAGRDRRITPEHYHHVLETARMKAPGLAAALELARLMGLRSQEAVQSVQWIWGMGTGVGGIVGAGVWANLTAG
ncbi:Putative DNA-binding protein [Salmonella enterica subsp. enterica]|uniref:DNA-binding protein n=1 Tax=Salmonella enterica I TaxID=59201 RepID=A0A447U118_SALET|nr:Putative DNA-binding protein [Salmonella enterica subsp. enterica]